MTGTTVDINEATTEVEVDDEAVELAVGQVTAEVAVTEHVTEVEVSSLGLQGPPGPTGPRGPAGTQPLFTAAGPLYPRVGDSAYYLDADATIARVRVGLGTPAVGGPVVVAVLLNGASLPGAGAITVPAGEYTAAVDVNVPVLEGDALTVEVVSVGSTQPGVGLTVLVAIE